MKTKRVFTCFFSLIFLSASSQKPDSLKHQFKYRPNFMVGVDLGNAAVSGFAERKLFQGFVSTAVTTDLHAAADIGFEQSHFTKNGYNAAARGVFAKTGALYMLVKDPENQWNGFYSGLKLAGSFYRQTYDAVPVRGYQNNMVSVSFPGSTQASYWTEAVAGGRVRLFQSNLYLDVNIQPKFLVYTTKQEQIVPMIVPGFGRSSGKFNFGASWNLAYSF